MNRKDLEHRIRQMEHQAPPAALRERVLSEARIPVPPVTWSGRSYSEPTPRRDLRWRRFGVAAVLGVVVFIGACSGLNVLAGQQVEEEIAALEKKYGRLDESTLSVPAVPDADNRARVARDAAALVQGRDTYFTRQDLGSPIAGKFRAFAEANRAAVNLAGDILNRRQSNWQLDYQRDTPPFTGLRALSDAIYVNTLLALEANRVDEAVRFTATGLGVAASFRQEPALTPQLIRIWLANRHVEAVQEIVSRSGLSRAAIDELAHWVEENRYPPAMKAALLGELMHANATMARVEKGDPKANIVEYLYPMTWPEWPKAWITPAARLAQPIVRLSRIRYLRYIGHLMDVETGPLPHPAVPEQPEPWRFNIVGRLTQKFTSGYERVIETGDIFASTLNTTAVALALCRFKLDRGAYPGELSELVPGYLASLPDDPFTGRPPMYARQGAGFTLVAHPNPKPYWLSLNWTILK